MDPAPPGERRIMSTTTVTVGSAVGLHARPAALIAERAGELGSPILIGLPGQDPVDASSALLLMTLGAGHGAQVEVSGEDDTAVSTIAALVAKDLDA
jgi:phosphocarrier protein